MPKSLKKPPVSGPEIINTVNNWNVWDRTYNSSLKCSKKYLVKLENGDEIEAFYSGCFCDFSEPLYWVVKLKFKIGSYEFDHVQCINNLVTHWKELD